MRHLETTVLHYSIRAGPCFCLRPYRFRCQWGHLGACRPTVKALARNEEALTSVKSRVKAQQSVSTRVHGMMYANNKGSFLSAVDPVRHQ